MAHQKYYLANTYISGILLKCVSFLSWKFWHIFTNIKILKNILLEEMHVFILLEYVSVSVFATRELRLLYNISSISYVFCNKHFTAFLECQIFKDKQLICLMKLKFETFILIWCDDLPSFFKIRDLFCVQNLFPTCIIATHYLKLSVNVFKKEWYKLYVVKYCFIHFHFPYPINHQLNIAILKTFACCEVFCKISFRHFFKNFRTPTGVKGNILKWFFLLT